MNRTNDLAIDLRDVAKTYRGKVRALRGISLQVRQGEIFGLLGPNGAGKSTLVKIMTTVVRPSRAAGTVLGRPIGHKPTLRRIGYLPEQARFAPYLTGRQVLEYYGALLGLPRRLRRRRAPELLGAVGMTQWADKKVGGYSKGMVQRVALAQALIQDPELVLLDEPTEGVDPLGRRHIRELLAALRDQGKTIFLNSHLLSETERVCNRVAILVEGSVVREGRLDELTRGKQFYEIETAGADPAALRRALPEQPPCRTEVQEARVRIFSPEAADVQPVLDALRKSGVVITALHPVGQSLEDFFVEILGDRPDIVGAAPAGGRTTGGAG